MKVIKEKFGSNLIRSRKPIAEDAYTRPFNLEFTVDGVKSSQTVNAVNVQAAKELIKKQYTNKNVLFQKSEEVKTPTNEALFDDEDFTFEPAGTEIGLEVSDVDDEYGDFDIDKFGNHDEGHEDTLSAPETGPASGISSVINALIIDEWEAIENYNSAIISARDCGYDDIVEVLTGIQNEENKHVGELQECLKKLTPSAEKITDGAEEAVKEMEDDGIEVSGPIDDDFYANI